MISDWPMDLKIWNDFGPTNGPKYDLGKKNESLSEKVWKMGQKYFFVYEIHQKAFVGS